MGVSVKRLQSTVAELIGSICKTSSLTNGSGKAIKYIKSDELSSVKERILHIISIESKEQ
jgi:hypothetical protein